MQSLLWICFWDGVCKEQSQNVWYIHKINEYWKLHGERRLYIRTRGLVAFHDVCTLNGWMMRAKTTVGHQTQRTTLTHNSYILDTNMNLHMGITWETHTFPGFGCFWTCGSISLDPSSPQWNMFYSLRKCIRQWLCTWSHTSKISRPHALMYCPGY